jgi:hypothetical protein
MSPGPGVSRTDDPQPTGCSRNRRALPSDTMATIVSRRRRPTLSPCYATLSRPLR